VDREEILAEIRRTADENGGKPLGRMRFQNASGIGKSDWIRHWAKFSDAQREAGFAPNELTRAYADDYLFEKAIELTRELGHYPTYDEFRTKAHNDRHFPRHGSFRRLGTKAQFVAELLAWCANKPQYSDIVVLIPPLPAEPLSEPATRSIDADGYGFVYLLRGHPGESR
jgi:hypothetical protein